MQIFKGGVLMKLYMQFVLLLVRKFIFRKNNGEVIKKFAEKMGIVYIKLAQILATQNFGNLFTEKDRIILSDICDDCNPISIRDIEKILHEEYGDYHRIFASIEEIPLGSASVSQVHKGVLKNGDVVAIKIQRKDITKTIEKDIRRIRKLVHRFGKLFRFQNYTGGDRALSLYLDWIVQETDFENEINNIKLYRNFASNVNGKVNDTKDIKVPNVYEELCTNHVIVMEFINLPTINKLELNITNKERIVTALNSYIKSSFWALYHDEQIVFHGDPHSGNICIDDDGNIYFLDMGLLCILNEEDAKLCRDFFLTVCANNSEKLYQILVSYGNMSEKQKLDFKRDCKLYCESVQTKEVTHYFVDMLNICLNYEFVPPNFLFQMAKAFVCLNGINHFSNNSSIAKELLQEQTLEFLLNRSVCDCKEVLKEGVKIPSKIILNTLQHGVVNTISKLLSNQSLNQNIKESLDHLDEMVGIMNSSLK